MTNVSDIAVLSHSARSDSARSDSSRSDSAHERRNSPLLTAIDGRQGLLSRAAVRRRRDFPDLASSTSAAPHT
ncbi:hypothetical protein, partial [Streptomyces sp. uw30]|uniref:hypothetical protein n=1 Tax=Streptomyces sp. uw30 TaxID=1828179 RepID=UPI001C9CCE48